MTPRDTATDADDPPRPFGADGTRARTPTVANRELLAKLGREYAGRVTPDAIVNAVLDAEDLMTSARIDAYVPILVERHAREVLRREARLIEGLAQQVRAQQPGATDRRIGG